MKPASCLGPHNLDLESVSALAESVKTFEGAVVAVSHDQFFYNFL